MADIKAVLASIDQRIPTSAGVYLACSIGPYYVGASKNMRARLRQHVQRKTSAGRMLYLHDATCHVLEVVEDLDWLGSREAIWAYRMRTGQTVVSFNNWRRYRPALREAESE